MSATQVQSLSLTARFAVHIVSFIVQDALHLVALGAIDSSATASLAGLGDENVLKIVFGLSVCIATIAAPIVWFCWDEDSCRVRPTSFGWLFTRAALVLLAAGLGVLTHLGFLAPIAVPALTMTLAALAVVTLFEVILLSYRGIKA
ncbi:MAG: hypothetical protein IT366_11730 [Candidatus Hydrogenedentes bacterium]|nr:hypothetical protein [Candidatus Hydrogenedentota bacterium]